MNKTVVIMLGVIIIILIALSYFGGVSFKELKEKVNATKDNITNAQKDINDAIKNIDDVKFSIQEAKQKMDSANGDLKKINIKLRQEFGRIQADIANLEEKRQMLDKQIEDLKNLIPGEIKELRKPNYEKIGEVR